MDERRKELRYENSALPYDLCNVFLKLSDGAEFIAKLNNICSCGVRLTLPTDEFYNPEKPLMGMDMVVNFPLKDLKARAECINIQINANRTVTFGLYFLDLYQQKLFNEMLILSANMRMPA